MSIEPGVRRASGLDETLSVLRRRRSIALQTFVLVLAAGVLVTMMTRPSYRAWARLQVASGTRSVNLVETSNPFAAMLAAASPESLATQLQIMQSGPFLTAARERARVVPREGVDPANVRIEAVEEASVIQVVVEGGDPQEIARFANAIVDLHLEQTDLNASQGLRDTLTFIKSERVRAGRSLSRADDALLRFRRKNRVAQLSAEQQAQTREYVDLQARVQELTSNLRTVDAQIALTRTQLAALPVFATQETVRENPRVQRIQDKLDELRFRKLEYLADFKPTSQTIRSLETQIDSLQRELAAEPREIRSTLRIPNADIPPLKAELRRLETSRHGYAASLAAAQGQLATRSSILDNLAPWELELSRLTRERDAAQASYARLTEQVRDLEIRTNARVPTARLIERAREPSQPFKPRRSVNLAVTMVLGLCLAVGMAFLQEFLDDRLNTADDLERVSGLPLLATVPHLEASGARLLDSLPAHSHAAESYRSLRASIQFAGFDAPIRSLLVTSASKGEGKTLTSANLAISIAQEGRRVVLVDADLRRPGVHGLLGMASAPGLTEVLVGLEPLEAVLRPTSVPGLTVVCAGAVPPNPAELLGSEAFLHLMEGLRSHCDFLILDSPPCLPVSDPLVLALRADAAVVVVQVGKTRKADLSRTEELLRRARARVVGAVYNRMPARRRGDPASYHYYYYTGPAPDASLPNGSDGAAKLAARPEGGRSGVETGGPHA